MTADHSHTHRGIAKSPTELLHYCRLCGARGLELSAKVCSAYDFDVALQERFAAELDKLIGVYALCGLGPQGVRYELVNKAAELEGET